MTGNRPQSDEGLIAADARRVVAAGRIGIIDEGLSALRAVDHVVVFDDVNCLAPLRAFCPDCFIKSSGDRARPIVQAEAALVKKLGGDVLYLDHHHVNYSSTILVRAIRQSAAQAARHA